MTPPLPASHTADREIRTHAAKVIVERLLALRGFGGSYLYWNNGVPPGFA